jgi:hypothetical protein
MRYRGVMFRPKDKEGFAICIPYIGKDGDDHLAPIHEVQGWDTEANTREILLAEFVISDGNSPMTFDEYLKVAGKPIEDASIYIKSVVVAKAECITDVDEIMKTQPSAFIGLCVDKILEASRIGMFNEEVVLSEWKKMGYDKSDVGESVELAME